MSHHLTVSRGRIVHTAAACCWLPRYPSSTLRAAFVIAGYATIAAMSSGRRSRLSPNRAFQPVGASDIVPGRPGPAPARVVAPMNVFELGQRVIGDFGDYVRSFISIPDRRIREKVDGELRDGLLWPEPRIGSEPRFASRGEARLGCNKRASIGWVRQRVRSSTTSGREAVGESSTDDSPL